jgi:hypothetical protein
MDKMNSIINDWGFGNLMHWESDGLDGGKTPEFSAANLKDPHRFANKLLEASNKSDPLSIFLQGKLSQEEKDELSRLVKDDPAVSNPAKARILAGLLNRAAASGSIYKEAHLAPVHLHEETRPLVQLTLCGAELVRLNRRLLEEAYPEELVYPWRISTTGPAEEPWVAFTTEDRVGLSLSGGGIRSATFNLGLLQMLPQTRVLQRLHYPLPVCLC